MEAELLRMRQSEQHSSDRQSERSKRGRLARLWLYALAAALVYVGNLVVSALGVPRWVELLTTIAMLVLILVILGLGIRAIIHLDD